MTTDISDLDDNVSEYESNCISKRSDETYVMLDKQIVMCMKKVDEYKSMLETSTTDVDEKDFHALCDEMELIMNTDMSNISLHEKIALYLKLVNNIKICEQHIQTKKLQIIEL